MAFQEDTSHRALIKSYADGKLVVDETSHTESLIIDSDGSIYPWAPQTIDELNDDAISTLLAYKPSFILLGTGEKHHLPPKKIMQLCHKHGIALEHMSTRAACRTHLAVSNEGRSCLTALIIR